MTTKECCTCPCHGEESLCDECCPGPAELRVRKPKVSPEPVEASEPAPGNAGNRLDEALTIAAEQLNSPVLIHPFFRRSLRVLSAEVRRLRAITDSFNAVYETHTNQLRSELELKSTTSAQIAAESVRLRDKLELVAKLPEAWRLQQRMTGRESLLARELAADLETALK